jgi:hypothetical protein
MTIKTIVVLLIGLALASVDFAEAQQTKQVAQIAFLTSSTPSFNLPRFKHSGKVFMTSVT